MHLCPATLANTTQAGLLPGILYQSAMNGTRLGMFAPMQRLLKAGEGSGCSA
jgi:hypothetical protein